MNYELCKKLKDAGFKQRPSDLPLTLLDKLGGEECYIPRLSELIEACGDKFQGLILDWNYKTPNERYWFAGYITGEDFKAFIDDDEAYGVGSTPEEAVANLWLQLSEKK